MKNVFRPVVIVAAVLLVAGCGTPNHTNTLIFGTNTKFALDVSQDPTGAAGITIGYKRQEAVWMPLLANRAGKDDKAVPADCSASAATDNYCKFSGKAGEDSTNGAKAEDTYSVIATFGGHVASGANTDIPPAGDAAAAAPKAKGTVSANGGLTQYFATGLAARILASQGSSIVNSAGSTRDKITAEEIKEIELIKQQVSTENKNINRVIVYITDSDGTLSKTKLSTLIENSPDLQDSVKKRLKDADSLDIVQGYLSRNYDQSAKLMVAATY
ncbi:hypothetical protein [Sphaerotilus montanus]|uniref:hypothetical protein n=1 Tax=Sphaerotilus montanus TaxID=522889 RepID=UPI003FA1CE7C